MQIPRLFKEVIEDFVDYWWNAEMQSSTWTLCTKATWDFANQFAGIEITDVDHVSVVSGIQRTKLIPRSDYIIGRQQCKFVNRDHTIVTDVKCCGQSPIEKEVGKIVGTSALEPILHHWTSFAVRNSDQT